MSKVFVPCDAAALSMGADAVANAIAAEGKKRKKDVEIVRNGSRGMLFLEPLVEVETEKGRIAYGPVTAADVPDLFKADFLAGGSHKLSHGLTEEIPYFKKQERLTFARCGIIDPLSIEDYRAHAGFEGLTKALDMDRADIVAEVTTSGLRGRGGAGFPTGIKWKTVLDAKADQKYICCNADEGDSGTFADRMLMEGDPFCLIEGMIIAGIAVGATKGYIYIRSEYPQAVKTFREAIKVLTEANWLGRTIQGSPYDFELFVRVGAGAYICGEETSMLDSLEGKRGIVRYKPPLPAIEGLFGQPTVINNVVSLASVPIIIAKGGEYYATSASGARAARSPSSSPATSSRAASSRRRSASPRASWSKGSAAARCRGGPCAPFSSAARSAPIFQSRSSTTRWTMRPSSRRGRWSATAASSCSTTRSTWPSRHASPWSSAPRNRAASARPAASGRCAA